MASTGVNLPSSPSLPKPNSRPNSPGSKSLSLPNMIIAIATSLILGFAGGFYVGLKNANSGKVAKAKSIFDEISK